MPESADLLAAVAAAPADDQPRLIYADWLDDRGEPDHATFVRDQIRLAQVPSWDPLAVRARHQRKETLGIGRPFYGTLPELPLFLKWHPEKAFRRGFGTGVVVNQLSGLIEAGPHLFDLAPVDELWLGAASLDEWRSVARSPWLKNIRKVHLHFSQGLHEPIRCLAESPYSGNIDEIWFDTLATPAAGAVIEILAASPLARQLTGLHMRLVHTPSLPEVIAALAVGRFEKLERFSMVQAGLGYEIAYDLPNLPFLSRLKNLDLSQNQIEDAIDVNMQYIPFDQLQSVAFNSCSLNSDSYFELAEGSWLKNVKQIQLNDNFIMDSGIDDSTINSRFPNLESLHMSGNQFNSYGLSNITYYNWWSHYVEIDWSNNTASDVTAEVLINSRPNPNLFALVLSPQDIGIECKRRLESHFGDRLVWAADDAATGLAR